MMPVGHEVAREEERLAAIGNPHGLRAPRVTLDAVETDAVQDLDGLVDELEAAGRLERGVVVRYVGPARALVRVEGILPLEALENIARPRERRNDPLALPIGVAARVVEM